MKRQRVEFEVGVFVERVSESQTKVMLTLKKAGFMSMEYGKVRAVFEVWRKWTGF